MAQYLYRTFVVTDDTNYHGLSAAEKTQHATDKTDYETNFQSLVLEINEILLAETTIVIEKDYTAFKALIVSPIVWGDVDVITEDTRYDMHLLSGSPL